MDNICSHLRSICNKFTQSSLQRFIGKLNKIADTATYVNACKELARIALKCETGEFNEIFESAPEKPHWVFSEYPKGLTCKHPSGCEVNVFHKFKEPFINEILTMDPSDPNTHKVRAGLMKLHTAREGLPPSRAEQDEIYGSIMCKPNVLTLDFQKISEKYHVKPVIDHVIDHLVRKGKPKREYLPLFCFPPSTKYSFCLDHKGQGRSRPRTDMRCYVTRNILKVPEIISLYDTDPEEFIAAGFTGFYDPGSFIIFDDDKMFPSGLPDGKVTSINERGNKHRVVANPGMLENILGYPLARTLTVLYERWSCQGCKSHEKTAKKISELIAKSLSDGSNLTFHSIDMKSFTDHLPYEGFQRLILEALVERNIIPKFDLKVMDRLCSMRFKFLDTNKIVWYMTGTPMGSFPSFPLATLANGVLLACASFRAGITDLDNLPGLIIGDDIVIWDDAVAQNYRELAQGLGLIVSADKSISSKYVAEMCSKIITKDGVFEQKKMKPTVSAGAMLKDVEYYGLQFISSLNDEYLKICEYLKMVPRPYGLGREMYEIRSDLDLSIHTGLELNSLLNPIEMHFLLKHIDNQLGNYLGIPLDQSSVHLAHQRMRYYPTIVRGDLSLSQSRIFDQLMEKPIPINNIDPVTNLPKDLDGRNCLRRMLQNSIEELRSKRASAHLPKLDALKSDLTPEELATIAHVARVTEDLWVYHEDDPISPKPLASIKEEGDSEGTSVLEDSFEFYQKR